jgi:hypothetical protein
LDDLTELNGFIMSSLPYYVNLEEELQLLAGDNTGENLHGFLGQVSSFNASLLSPSAGWNRIDIVGRVIQQITSAKEIAPTFIVLNPADWWSMRLQKDSFGRYILGDPQSMVRPNIFGLTAVATTSIAPNTFLVGSGDPVASEIRDRMTDPSAQRVHAHMKMGSVRGLSIGFGTPDPAKTSFDDNGNRILREIRLFELSLCPVPANPLAMVTSVKSLAQVERFMQSMRGKSPDAEMLAHLQAIHEHVLSLLADVDDDGDGDSSEAEDELLLEMRRLIGQVSKLTSA